MAEGGRRPRWPLIAGITATGAAVIAGAWLLPAHQSFLAGVLVEVGGALVLFAALALAEPALHRTIRQAAEASELQRRHLDTAKTVLRTTLHDATDERRADRAGVNGILEAQIRELGQHIVDAGLRQRRGRAGVLTFGATTGATTGSTPLTVELEWTVKSQHGSLYRAEIGMTAQLGANAIDAWALSRDVDVDGEWWRSMADLDSEGVTRLTRTLERCATSVRASSAGRNTRPTE